MLERRSTTVAPSILAADLARLGEQMGELSAVAGVDRIHVDIMDGHFVPNLSFGPAVVDAVRRSTSLPLDLHLMVTDPRQYYQRFVAAGASGLTVHVESVEDIASEMRTIHELGVRAGITLNPSTPVSAIRAALDEADLVLIMSVMPGFGGQAFIPETIARIRAVRNTLDALGRGHVDVEVDGGINELTAPLVVQAGANLLVAGSYVFGHPQGMTYAVRSLLPPDA